jgi:hypothetical protein
MLSKEVNNNVEIVCTDGIPINYNLEKVTENNKIINIFVNVDTIDIVSKDLVAKANVRLQTFVNMVKYFIVNNYGWLFRCFT